MYRLKMYYKWKRMLSIYYLNGQGRIGNELQLLDKYVTTLQDDLRNLHEDNTYGSKFQYITIIRGKSKTQLSKQI